MLPLCCPLRRFICKDPWNATSTIQPICFSLIKPLSDKYRQPNEHRLKRCCLHVWHQIPFIRALQRLQNPPDDLNHCLCLFTWYVTYKCTKYKTFTDKCFTQKRKNKEKENLSNQIKCYGFIWDVIASVERASWVQWHTLLQCKTEPMVLVCNRSRARLNIL